MPNLVEKLLATLPWVDGRQQTGYKKIRLIERFFNERFAFDAYLLFYPEGSEIPPHTDKVGQGRHYRMNLVLRDCARGGDFQCERTIFKSRRFNLFRPDENEHSVKKIEKGSRLVFSLGWVRK